MSFTVNDLQDLTRLLATHPEWLSEVRRLVLTEEVLSLPEVMRGLAEAQRRTEERLEQLTARVDQLAEAQRRTEERLEQLTARVDQLTERVGQLAEAQRRTEERLEQLTARVDQLTERVDQLTARVDQLTERVDQLTERMEQLTARMDQLAEAQRRTEERLEQLTARVDQLTERVGQLAEAQRRTEERLEQLTARVDQLTERVDQLTERMDQLAEAQRRTEERLNDLAKTVQHLVNQMAEVRGDTLEIKFRDKAPAYFGRWLRRVRVVPIIEIEEQLEAVLDSSEITDLFSLDLLVRGRTRTAKAEATDMWLAVEVSSVIDANDVRRAEQRAKLLQRAGFRAMPVAAGARIDPEAQALAESLRVAVVKDGAETGWEQAYDSVPG